MASEILLHRHELSTHTLPPNNVSYTGITNLISFVSKRPVVTSEFEVDTSKFSRRTSVRSVMTAETGDETMNTQSVTCPLDDDNDDFDLYSNESNEDKDDSISSETERQQLLLIQQGLHNVHMTEDSTDAEVSDQDVPIDTSTSINQRQHQASSVACEVGNCLKSILKRTKVDEIPIRNKGWRNLPKVDLHSLRSLHASLKHNDSQVYAPSTLISRPKKVNFGEMRIRNYSQTIGDNPSVSFGTPIALDWEYEEIVPTIMIEDYEAVRCKRRSPRQMMLNYYHRRNILQHAYGYSEQQLDLAEKCTNKFKRQRNLTKLWLPCFVVEDMVTSAVRKTKRNWSKRSKADGLLTTAGSDDVLEHNFTKSVAATDIDISNTSKATNVTSSSTLTSCQDQNFEAIEL